jgi:threonine-phosphate decarboxylase
MDGTPMTHGGDLFAIAAAQGWDWREVADFSASINPLGPAPGVRPAICRAIDRIQHYPEREPMRLRRALGEKWNVHPDCVLLGNGATELIFFLDRVLQDHPISLATPVFSEFHRAFPAAHLSRLGDPTSWPSDAALVLTRPVNPTGTTLDLSLLRQRLGQSAKPLIVDESFLEFSGLPSASILLPQNPHLIVLRSLTKFYALPGLRLGAVIGDAALVNQWRKQREPWQVNVLAEEAALAALRDEHHAQHTIDFVRGERDFLASEISALPGCQAHASDANFIYVSVPYPATDLASHLMKNKVLVRNCAEWPGLSGEAVRIAVRTRAENERLLQAWKAFRCV